MESLRSQTKCLVCMTSKKPETVFKERVQKDLDSLGSDCWHVKIQQVSIVGTPDMLICAKGIFIALELKKDDKEEPKPIQIYTLNQIQKAKGHALVAHPNSWRNVFAFIKAICER